MRLLLPMTRKPMFSPGRKIRTHEQLRKLAIPPGFGSNGVGYVWVGRWRRPVHAGFLLSMQWRTVDAYLRSGQVREAVRIER